MTNPFQPSGMPSFGDFNDPLGFVKNLWGDMKIPGMVTPTLSIDELDQQIKDLKAVESWLSLNMNMLRGSIQALEVQRSTIAALKSMGENFAKNSAPEKKAYEAPKAEPVVKAQAQTEPEQEPKPEAAATPAWAMPSEAGAWWNVVQDQFQQALSQVIVPDADVQEKKPQKSAATTTKKPKTTGAAGTASKTSAANKTAASPRKKAAVKKPVTRKPAVRKTK